MAAIAAEDLAPDGGDVHSMYPSMPAFIAFACLVLAIPSLFGVRWTYILFIVLGLAYFPLRVGFRFDPHPCEVVTSARYLAPSLTNYGHIVRFALFFAMSTAQVRKGL